MSPGDYIAALCAVIALIALAFAWKSACAAHTSAETAKEMLAEGKRQHRVSIRPSVTASVENQSIVVHNTGPGPARRLLADLRYRAHAKHSPYGEPKEDSEHTRRVVVSLRDLEPDGKEVIHERRIVVTPYVFGTLSYEDIDGTKYWSAQYRETATPKPWEFGEGEPPVVPV